MLLDDPGNTNNWFLPDWVPDVVWRDPLTKKKKKLNEDGTNGASRSAEAPRRPLCGVAPPLRPSKQPCIPVQIITRGTLTPTPSY